MARAKSGRAKKYNWMQTRLEYQLLSTASGLPYADSHYIDVARGLSLINRKLVRQGQLFRIKGLRVYQTGDTSNRRFKVATIPTNWVSRNAWVKGKALWDEMNATALSSGNMAMMPKYHDYKVMFNAGHKTDLAAGKNPIPCDADGNPISTTSSEWVYSEYADSGGDDTGGSDNYDVKFLGFHEGTTTNYTCVSLIEAYRQSRIRPQSTDPQWPIDAINSPWMKLFGDDDQTSDVLTNLDEDNDAPPYDPSRYPGDGLDDGGFGVITSTPMKSSGAAGGLMGGVTFNAPCGLIRVEIDDDSTMTNVPVTISFDVEILGPMDM